MIVSPVAIIKIIGGADTTIVNYQLSIFFTLNRNGSIFYVS